MITAHTTFHKIQKGFTLIELLIVIAILGVLAAAVLSAINPVEQINRGRDTGSLSDAEQLHSAIDRYNAAQGYLPWQAGEGSADTQLWQVVKNAAYTDKQGTNFPTGWLSNAAGTPKVLDLLGTNTAVGGTGELLPAYETRLNDTTSNPLYVYKAAAAGSSVYVCFLPQSGSIEQKAATRCAGSPPSDFPAEACPAAVGSKKFYCLP
jgi:prepilin-type N-terminal cleavage/methylation domain-containing protein